jgi:hypothetical protein
MQEVWWCWTWGVAGGVWLLQRQVLDVWWVWSYAPPWQLLAAVW